MVMRVMYKKHQKKLPKGGYSVIPRPNMNERGRICTAGKTAGVAASGYLPGLRHGGVIRKGKTFIIGSCQNAAWRTDTGFGAQRSLLPVFLRSLVQPD